MILINLLPHREAARKRRRELFFATLGLSALVGVVVAGLVFGWYQAKIGIQEERNRFLTQEITKLDGQIKEIANLQAEISALRARQQAVEDLQSDRNLPVQLLNELVAQMPDGVFINRLSQRGPTAIEFGGSAQSDERVNELLKNLTYGSEWIGSPELIEITAGQFQVAPNNPQGARRISNFSMRAALKRPQATTTTAVVSPARPPVTAGSAPAISTPTTATPSNAVTSAAAAAKSALQAGASKPLPQ
jgi:type IV pilus assembly protein PilN